MSTNAKGLENIDIAKESLKKEIMPLFTALIASAFGLISLAALIYLQIYKQQVIPYIVTVDRQGAILTSGALNAAKGIPEEIIAATSCDFVEKIRTNTLDNDLKRKNIEFIYAHTKNKSQALAFIDDFYKNNFKKIQDIKTSVQFQNLIRISKNTFQIDWIETLYLKKGEIKKKMRGLITYELIHISHRSLSSLKVNPLGIFVSEIRISERFENRP